MATNPLTDLPKTHALLALFCFQAARLDSRFDENGDILLLSEQDRTLWDKKLISDGLKHLRLSAKGDELSDYHLEAEIASVHAISKDFASTDWKRIYKCYDKLSKVGSSPVVLLNKIVALVQIEDAETGLKELEKLRENSDLKNYLPFYLTFGELQTLTGQTQAAVDLFKRALELSDNETIRRFLRKKISKITHC